VSQNQLHYINVSQIFFFLVDPFWLHKTTPDPYNPAHVNVACLDERYPKLKVYNLKLILDSYEYTPVA
jgi:hypothetical protein